MSTSERQAELEGMTKVELTAILDKSGAVFNRTWTKTQLIDAVIVCDTFKSGEGVMDEGGPPDVNASQTGVMTESPAGVQDLGAPQQPPILPLKPDETAATVQSDGSVVVTEANYNPQTHVLLPKDAFAKMVYDLTQGYTQNYTGRSGQRRLMEMLGAKTVQESDELYAHFKAHFIAWRDRE